VTSRWLPRCRPTSPDRTDTRSLALDGVVYRRLSDVHVDTQLMLVNRRGDLSTAASTVRDLILDQLRTGH